jgi:signal transduction histidine kinase
MAVPTHPDEEARLRTLDEYRILDTPPEPRFDDIVELARELIAAPTSLITLVDRDRQWFKAERGFGRRETPRDLSFCAHAICDRDALIVPNAVDDPRFRANDLVVGAPGIRFYAGTPIHAYNGLPLGTLCVLDHRPRELEPRHRDTLVALGRQVEVLLEHRRLATERVELLEHHANLVRFVVHDVSNALTAVALVTKSLRRRLAGAADLLRLADDLEDGTAHTQRILDSLRDVERADRGALPRRDVPVDAAQLLADAGRRWRPVARRRDRDLAVDVGPGPLEVRGDPGLLARVLDNLVVNAIEFAPPGSIVTIGGAAGADGGVELWVADLGAGVPAGDRARIFELYATAGSEPPGMRTSTGLGLAFCRVAVAAHGGRIRVDDNHPTGAVVRAWLPSPP